MGSVSDLGNGRSKACNCYFLQGCDSKKAVQKLAIVILAFNISARLQLEKVSTLLLQQALVFTTMTSTRLYYYDHSSLLR
jgi:hypothetical protein